MCFSTGNNTELFCGLERNHHRARTQLQPIPSQFLFLDHLNSGPIPSSAKTDSGPNNVEYDTSMRTYIYICCRDVFAYEVGWLLEVKSFLLKGRWGRKDLLLNGYARRSMLGSRMCPGVETIRDEGTRAHFYLNNIVAMGLNLSIAVDSWHGVHV